MPRVRKEAYFLADRLSIYFELPLLQYEDWVQDQTQVLYEAEVGHGRELSAAENVDA